MVCQKSDYLIVVMKCVKAHGAKGITNQRFLKGNTWDTGGSFRTWNMN
ncbi:hypothetical protein FACS1894204_11710 [Synergistales bacterium]|nr:hypothetical protein FACS1894204_11710 [Synergistales bacterium]